MQRQSACMHVHAATFASLHCRAAAEHASSLLKAGESRSAFMLRDLICCPLQHPNTWSASPLQALQGLPDSLQPGSCIVCLEPGWAVPVYACPAASQAPAVAAAALGAHGSMPLLQHSLPDVRDQFTSIFREHQTMQQSMWQPDMLRVASSSDAGVKRMQESDPDAGLNTESARLAETMQSSWLVLPGAAAGLPWLLRPHRDRPGSLRTAPPAHWTP